MLQQSSRPSLGIVGAGRVGQTLAQTLWAHEYVITAIYSHSALSAAPIAEQVQANVVSSAAQVVQAAQLTIIAVPDRQIESVCNELAADDVTGRAVVHTSGAVPISALNAAKRRGALIGGLHPFLPIARPMQLPPNSVFGIEADREPLRGWLSGLVDAMAGTALWLRPGIDRTQYHAAAVLTSNYLVTLFAESLALLSPFTADSQIAKDALLSLAQVTLDNLTRTDPAHALTGPIVRGDAVTVQTHLTTLDKKDPELAEIYRLLGKRTARLAAARGLDAEQIKQLDEVLQNHANNDP